jgi:hypothetical protein
MDGIIELLKYEATVNSRVPVLDSIASAILGSLIKDLLHIVMSAIRFLLLWNVVVGSERLFRSVT